jgi:hypothetical protein
MARIVWLVIGLLVLVLMLPQARERVRPQIETVLNPIYRWEARNRVKDISRVLERERSQEHPLPKVRDFQRFLAAREGAQSAVDPWDQPYYLLMTRRTFQVGSAGQDRRPNTADDILSPAEPLDRGPGGPARRR